MFLHSFINVVIAMNYSGVFFLFGFQMKQILDKEIYTVKNL